MSISAVFAISLKHYRQRASLSQDELALSSDLDRTYISDLERSRKSPTLRTLERLAQSLNILPTQLMRPPPPSETPLFPGDYLINPAGHVIVQLTDRTYGMPATQLASAINIAHDLIDELYGNQIDIAAILGLRNLSAFVGELLVHSIVQASNSSLVRNPHQDGYPDLLVMDDVGAKEWNRLKTRQSEKSPFSPFGPGGIEVKATCGAIPSASKCSSLGIDRPALGDTRIGCLTGHDWKAHHRETNNLIGLLWDFVGSRPRIVAVFFSSELEEENWGRIVSPRTGGGRTTSVSIMNRSGLDKMHDGWLCIYEREEYLNYLSRRSSSLRRMINDLPLDAASR